MAKHVKVRINFSSLDVINVCPRKAYYSLHERWKSNDSAPPLVFGSAIHKALETWYLGDIDKRTLPKNFNDQAQRAVHGFEVEDEESVAIQAIKAFANECTDVITPDNDARSLENGAKILANYFKTYQNDNLTILRDANGPMVERMGSFTMYETESLTIEYFGTVDAIFRNEATGIITVADHKTTSTLGTQFYSRLKPNHQYTGYIEIAKRCFGLDTSLFMVNGIQVAKTKHDLVRQITKRDEQDFIELQSAVIDAVDRYLTYMRRGNWPQTAPNPCTMYGNCAYLKVCSTPLNVQQTILENNWTKEVIQ